MNRTHRVQLKLCVDRKLFDKVESFVEDEADICRASGSYMSTMQQIFLREYPLIARRQKFFMYDQKQGQLASDYVREVEQMGREADMGNIKP